MFFVCVFEEPLSTTTRGATFTVETNPDWRIVGPWEAAESSPMQGRFLMQWWSGGERAKDLKKSNEKKFGSRYSFRYSFQWLMKTEWPSERFKNSKKNLQFSSIFCLSKKWCFPISGLWDFGKKNAKSRRNLETTPPQPCLAFARKALKTSPCVGMGVFLMGFHMGFHTKNRPLKQNLRKNSGGGGGGHFEIFRQRYWVHDTAKNISWSFFTTARHVSVNVLNGSWCCRFLIFQDLVTRYSEVIMFCILIFWNGDFSNNPTLLNLFHLGLLKLLPRAVLAGWLQINEKLFSGSWDT